MVPSISLVGLKGSTFDNLNSEGHTYLESLMSLGELMKIVCTFLSFNLNLIYD